jgi:type VI secretion system VasD/TssJ family lipoprotein
MRSALLLALALGACSSVKNHELRFRGDPQMNQNENRVPNVVKVRVLLLKGPGAATRFAEGDFNELWNDPGKVLTAQGLHEAPVPLDVLPGKEPPLPLEKVPPEVTHVGVLALFDPPVKGKDRVLLEMAQVGERELWLHGYEIEARDPDAKPAEKPAEKAAEKPAEKAPAKAPEKGQ